jgi:L-lactate dehydrogenase (cytochrome)
MGIFRTLRSVVALRKFDFNGRRRRLAKCGDIGDVRRLAKRNLPGGVFDYFDGAAETEWSMANNSAAFERVHLSPTGFTRIATSAGETAVARVAARHGVPYTLSTLGTRSIEEVAAARASVTTAAARASAASTSLLWYQLYVWKDRGLSRELVQRAKAAGYQAIMVTVDTAVFGRRDRDVRRGFTLPPKIGLETFIDGVRHPRWTLDFITHEPITFSAVSGRGDLDGSTAITLSDYVNSQFDASLSWRDLDWVRSESGLPIMLKGIQSVDDALRARSEGVEAIALSNHGGRQFDGSPAPIELLPSVMDAVGDGIEVLVDGGVRRGSDVVKACALGARAVMFGRPYLYGLGAAGELGVEWVINYFTAGVKRTMALVGATDVASLRGLVRR